MPFAESERKPAPTTLWQDLGKILFTRKVMDSQREAVNPVASELHILNQRLPAPSPFLEILSKSSVDRVR